mmetsp:Transcript_143458/g.253338  ORF Transcript_143458/g.253338 Transcript_143458/m.253338 type:complete len:151 (+) Transcript_143458:48-500(+)
MHRWPPQPTSCQSGSSAFVPFTPSAASTASPAPVERVEDAAPGPVAEHSAEEIDGIVRHVIGEVLGDTQFIPGYVDTWCDQIMEQSLKRIASLARPFKYIATCVVSKQKPGYALDTAATAFWDTHSDSLCCTRCGNGNVDCIVTIYACRR